MQGAVDPWKEILEVEPVAVHTFWKGWKRFKDIGKLIIYQKQDGTHWKSINHGFTYEIVKDTIFYKLVFQSFTSYLKESISGGFVALSFENGCDKLPQWENIVKKIGTLEDFNKAHECPMTKKKIEYHCPNIHAKSIHTDSWTTPFYKWGGKVQDTVLDKTQRVMKGGSSHQDYAQKTKRWIRNSWAAFKIGVKDTKQSIKEKLHLDSNKRVQLVEETNDRKGKKRRQDKTVEASNL